MAVSKRIKKQKRQKFFRTLFRVILGVIIAAAVALLVIFLVRKVFRKAETDTVRYVGGISADVEVYYYDEYERRLFSSDDTITRGTEVNLVYDSNGEAEQYTENGRTYTTIEYEGETYYIKADYLVEDERDIIQETEKWVRTSAVVYASYEGPEIVSFVKKGTHLEVTGYDELLDDGSINMYEVNIDGTVGWVFGKYLVDSQKAADAINEEIYEIHKDRNYGSDLYGGTAADLDWYPYEKPEFTDNTLLDDARCMYICTSALASIDDYLAIAKSNGVNAMVVDVKDGQLICKMDTATELSPTSASYIRYDESYVSESLQKIKDAGLYLILRIVVFKDETYALDHPENCIESDSATQEWPSGYSRDVWYYNVRLALEAIEKFSPNEIQFDYVRFPEESYKMSQDESTDFKNEYDEEKCEAIQNFLIYACDQIHQKNVYVSADVFAECAGKYISAYGQYFPAISNVVDAISAMPYTDHFGTTTDTWTDCYTTVNDWAQRAAARQKEIETPALVRTWLTCYNVPWWSPTISCDTDYFATQAQALYDAGLTGGFLGWNGISNIEIYNLMAPAWGYDYGYGVGGNVTEKHASNFKVSSQEETTEAAEAGDDDGASSGNN